eukprot:m.392093 g.392093  ORF g.392093 m.392093 type:complete len:115 (+) comp21078_c2_seq6:1651-1995(+)
MDTGGLQIRTLYRMSAVAFTTNKHQVQIRSTHRIPCEQQHAQRSRLLIGVAMVASIEFDAQSSGDLVHNQLLSWGGGHVCHKHYHEIHACHKLTPKHPPLKYVITQSALSIRHK